MKCECGYNPESDFEFCPMCGRRRLGIRTDEDSVDDRGPTQLSFEAERSEVRLTPPAKRFGAWLVESFILGLPSTLMTEVPSLWALWILVWVWELVLWTKSKTIGKQIFHMTVVHAETYEGVSFGMMFLREIVGKFLSAIVLGLGFLWVAIDRDHQGWHDKIISSVVIEDR